MIAMLITVLVIVIFLISPVKILVSYNKDRLLIKAGVGALMLPLYNSAGKKKKKPEKEKKKGKACGTGEKKEAFA